MAAGIGIVILILGGFIGWFARRAYGMHGDMKVNKARVPTFRGQPEPGRAGGDRAARRRAADHQGGGLSSGPRLIPAGCSAGT